MDILIVGSCVSRDIFNFKESQGMNVVKYFARSSFISIMNPVSVDLNLDNIESSFQRRMVKADLRSSFFDEIEGVSFDFIMIDFIDERFDVLAFFDGFCTVSSELLSSGLSVDKEKVIKSGGGDWENLWKASFKDFYHEFIKRYPLKNILINKVYLSDVDDKSCSFDNDYVLLENKKLKFMYDYASSLIESSLFIHYPDNLFVGKNDHKWGRSPFHYIDELYFHSIDEINNKYLLSKNIKSKNHFDSLDDFLSGSSFKDGIYTIKFNGNRLCINLSGFSNLNSIFLVCFSGAIANRSGKVPPFFSGLGVSSTTCLPSISVSDPTLEMDDDISLAWYAGNHNWPNLPSDISVLVGSIAKAIKSKPIIYGGSGGGFAALNIASRLDVPASVFVWNPQTNISDYLSKNVEKYIETAFPYLDYDKASLYDALDKSGVVHDLKVTSLSNEIDVTYIQNKGDWHYKKHAIPFLNNLDLKSTGELAFNQSFCFGLIDQPDGHAPLGKDIICTSLRDISNGVDARSVATNLQALYSDNSVITDDLLPCIEAIEIDINKYSRGFTVGVRLPNTRKYSYSFYLLVDGLKYKVSNYSELNYTFFETDEISANSHVEVVSFIRIDESRCSKKISI